MQFNKREATMNTKTMRLPPRRVLSPDERKEPHGVTPTVKQPLISRASKNSGEFQSVSRETAKPSPLPSNQLLAGYFANEFLTKGTIFGERWDPVVTTPLPAALVGPRNKESTPFAGSSEGRGRAADNKHRRYLEVNKESTPFGRLPEGSGREADPKRLRYLEVNKESTPFVRLPEGRGRAEDTKRRRYLEVSSLFRSDGTHLPGIVNPPQLARFLKL